MYWPSRRVAAEPLTDDEVRELRDEGLGDLVVTVDGHFYNDEDLHRCDACSDSFPDPADLDDNLLCEDCAREADEEARHQEDLRRWYRSAVL